MTPRPSRPILPVTALVGLFLGVAHASSVQAQDCKADSDCGVGFICEVSRTTACSGGADAKPAAGGALIAVPIPADAGVVCSEQEVSYCAPAPCKADSECGTDRVCATRTSTACSGGTTTACAPGAKCDIAPAPSPECVTTSESLCAWRHEVSCKADADCGAGFRCEFSVTSCGGYDGGIAVPPTQYGDAAVFHYRDAGIYNGPIAIAAPAPSYDAGLPTCDVQTASAGYCQLLATACNSDADCPQGIPCGEYISDDCQGTGADAGPIAWMDGDAQVSGGGSSGSSGAGADIYYADAGTAPIGIYEPLPPSDGGQSCQQTVVRQCGEWAIPATGSAHDGSTSSADAGYAVATENAGGKGATSDGGVSAAQPGKSANPVVVAGQKPASSTPDADHDNVGGCSVGADANHLPWFVALGLLLGVRGRRRRHS